MESLKKVVLSPIDCFHWEELDAQNYRLVYFDPQGNQAEKIISKEKLESALKLFTGKTHLVKRSTGAYSPALPSKLMIYHCPLENSKIHESDNFLRVNAKFLDFERDSHGHILSDKLIAHDKSVDPDSFRLLTDKDDPFKHQYWIDLGSEIVAVTVFDFFRTQDDLIRASFVKTEDLKAISLAARGQKKPITIYSAPEAVLRVSLPKEIRDVIEAHTASRSILAIAPDKKIDIPEFLQFGPPQNIPTGSSIEVLNHYLRVCLDPHSISMKKSFLSVLEKPLVNKDETQLMPFGVFERA